METTNETQNEEISILDEELCPDCGLPHDECRLSNCGEDEGDI